jgi:hypothetical protein
VTATCASKDGMAQPRQPITPAQLSWPGHPLHLKAEDRQFQSCP